MPVLIPHPTDPTNPEYAAPLAITNDGSALPEATFGVPYSASVTVFGGQTPYSFTSSGLPGDLSIDPSTGADQRHAAAGGHVHGHHRRHGLGYERRG